jgi:hypothetical protein
MRLLLATPLLVIGCSSSPPECEADDGDVRAEFSITPEPPRGGWLWSNKTCTVQDVSSGAHTLVCPGIEEVLGTDTVTLSVVTDPPMDSPLAAGDAVSFAYYDRSHVVFDAFFSLRRNGSVVLAGQRSFKLAPSLEGANDFYAPITAELAVTQCNTEGHDCGDVTRVGVLFSGTTLHTVYDRQHRPTPDGEIWMEAARSVEANGKCSDTGGYFFRFILASP